MESKGIYYKIVREARGKEEEKRGRGGVNCGHSLFLPGFPHEIAHLRNLQASTVRPCDGPEVHSKMWGRMPCAMIGVFRPIPRFLCHSFNISQKQHSVMHMHVFIGNQQSIGSAII